MNSLFQDVPQRSSLTRHADSLLHRLASKDDASRENSKVLLRGVRVFWLKVVSSGMPSAHGRDYDCCKVPSANAFKSMLDKIRVKDYSARLRAGVLLLKSCVPARVVLCVLVANQFRTQECGRFKKRCMLACLGEAARKLTLVWLRFGWIDCSIPSFAISSWSPVLPFLQFYTS